MSADPAVRSILPTLSEQIVNSPIRILREIALEVDFVHIIVVNIYTQLKRLTYYDDGVKHFL